MAIRTAILFSLVLVLVGCAPEPRTFNLAIKNESASVVTLALTKDGPPVEPAWASPEDLAAKRAVLTPQTREGYASLPPGKTAAINGITGLFSGNTNAVLRVYRGDYVDHKDALLAIQPGPARSDITLTPGDNRFIIRDHGDSLSVEPSK